MSRIKDEKYLVHVHLVARFVFQCTIYEERRAMPSYFCFTHMYLNCAIPKLFFVSNSISINLWLLIIEEGGVDVYIHKILLVGRGNTDTDRVKNVDSLPSQEGWNSPYYADAILLPGIHSALSLLSTRNLKSVSPSPMSLTNNLLTSENQLPY